MSQNLSIESNMINQQDSAFIICSPKGQNHSEDAKASNNLPHDDTKIHHEKSSICSSISFLIDKEESIDPILSNSDSTSINSLHNKGLNQTNDSEEFKAIETTSIVDNESSHDDIIDLLPLFNQLDALEKLDRTERILYKMKRNDNKDPHKIFNELRDHLDKNGFVNEELLKHIFMGTLYYVHYQPKEALNEFEQIDADIIDKDVYSLRIDEAKLLRLMYNLKADMTISSYPTRAKEYLKREREIIDLFFADDRMKNALNKEVEAKLHIRLHKDCLAGKCLKQNSHTCLQENNLAEICLKEALEHYKNEHFYTKTAIVYLHLSEIYMERQTFPRVIECIMDGFDAAFKIDSENFIMGRYLCHMGTYYSQIPVKYQEFKPEKWFTKGLDILSKTLRPDTFLYKRYLQIFQKTCGFQSPSLGKDYDLHLQTDLMELKMDFISAFTQISETIAEEYAKN